MLTEQDFAQILNDASKRISVAIVWQDDEDHSPSLEFRAPVVSEAGWPLTVHGAWNPKRQSLSYVLVYRGAGRIVGLCLGFPPHPNPDGELMGDPHEHRWTLSSGDREAYEPDDITGKWSEPVRVWQQFCQEVRILHEQAMSPPPEQSEMQI